MPGRDVPRYNYWWQCYLAPRAVKYLPTMEDYWWMRVVKRTRRLEIVSEATSGECHPLDPEIIFAECM
ncbi:hypothetical protein IG631_15832 [Alternaria alternata]|nr:hypothetical protein IG631_15832 [Alternaria alternata]